MKANDFSYIRIKFEDNVSKAQYLKKIIRHLVNNGDLDKAEEKINEYKEMFSDDIEITSIEVVILIMKGEIDTAEQCALSGLDKVPFNFDLNYNLGCIYLAKQRYQEAVDAFILAGKVATNEDDILLIQSKINEIKEISIKVDFSREIELNQKLFPLKTRETTWIGRTLFDDKKKEGYIPLYYNEPFYDYPVQLWNLYKTETLEGKICECEKLYLDILNKTVLPLAVLEKDAIITLTIDNISYELDSFNPNRYYYIPFLSESKVKIECKKKFVIGKPISLVQQRKHDIKIALCIFIDGLSQELINEYSLEVLMPNTYKFFKKGTIFNNCYSNAEWTLPSVASIFSGRYPTAHKLFHPEIPIVIGDNYKIISEIFRDNDYLTFQACGDWRKSPSYGYVKGFDRTIYQSATIGSKVEDIISAFLEHMRAFEDRNHFIWLSFFELHHVDDNVTPGISNQVANSINFGQVKKDNKKSVEKGYDENKIERYINELKRLDYYLKIIFDFIEDKYKNDEILISLFSDHGQSYIDEGFHILREARTRVPLMFRGRDIPAAVSNEMIENIDILPIILKKSSIECEFEKIDGKIPKILGGEKEKEYVYSESIYPGKTYKAIIRDKEHTFIFESGNKVQEDGRFELGNFSIRLENRLTKVDETSDNVEKVTRYFDIVISHISKLIII